MHASMRRGCPADPDTATSMQFADTIVRNGFVRKVCCCCGAAVRCKAAIVAACIRAQRQRCEHGTAHVSLQRRPAAHDCLPRKCTRVCQVFGIVGVQLLITVGVACACLFVPSIKVRRPGSTAACLAPARTWHLHAPVPLRALAPAPTRSRRPTPQPLLLPALCPPQPVDVLARLGPGAGAAPGAGVR